MRLQINIGNFELILYNWGLCVGYDWRYVGWSSRNGFFRCLKSEHIEMI